jgi:hypothetical protein
MTLILSLAFLVLGLSAGAVHFALVARDADVVVRRGALWPILLLRIGRMALIAVLLYLAARSGALPLLAAAGGVFVARQWALKRFGTAA